MLVLLALAAIVYSSLPLAWQVTAGVPVCGYAVVQQRRLCRQRGTLSWCERWQWLEVDAEGRPLHPVRALTLRAAVIWPGLVVLRFHEVHARRRTLTLALCGDSLAAADMRRLRAHLRHWPVFE